MTNTLPITPADIAAKAGALDWALLVGELGEVTGGDPEIEQAFDLILHTTPGEDPHRPDFGADLIGVLDHRITEARPEIIRRVVSALKKWEPRVEIIEVRLTPLDVTAEAWALEISYRRKDTQEEGVYRRPITRDGVR
jgi:phage baseplate assembly protein W